MQLFSLNKISKFQLCPGTIATALVCWLSSYSMGLLIVFSLPSPLCEVPRGFPSSSSIHTIPYLLPYRTKVPLSTVNPIDLNHLKNVILHLFELLENIPVKSVSSLSSCCHQRCWTRDIHDSACDNSSIHPYEHVSHHLVIQPSIHLSVYPSISPAVHLSIRLVFIKCCRKAGANLRWL